MMRGAVEPDGDAVVRLRIGKPGSVGVAFRVVIDTGFNDELTLPASIIQELGLNVCGAASCSMADGSRSNSLLYAADVEWYGRPRGVFVIEMDGGPLLGMAMLRDSYLGIEVTDGGSVEIRPLDVRNPDGRMLS